MDGNQFDRLAQRFGRATNRRSALRVIFGGVVVFAGVGVTATPEGAYAACHGGGVRCNRDAACCSGTCAWAVRHQGRRTARIGTCTTPPCQELSASCGTGSDCCSGLCDRDGTPGHCNVCISNGYWGCRTTDDCCGIGEGALCGDDGRCMIPR